MMLARVVGKVWATAKNDTLDGKKMLVIQPLDPHLKPVGKRHIALDAVGAGSGELVYWCRGKESSFPWLPEEVPADCAIVGIVDEVNIS